MTNHPRSPLTFAKAVELLKSGAADEVRAASGLDPGHVYDADNRDIGKLRKGVLHKLIMGDLITYKRGDVWVRIWDVKR